MSERLPDIALVPRLKGRKPDDAVLVKCERCGATCLCRPGIEERGRREAFMRGRTLLMVCEVCGKEPFKRAIRNGDVAATELHPGDIDSWMPWIDRTDQEMTEEN